MSLNYRERVVDLVAKVSDSIKSYCKYPDIYKRSYENAAPPKITISDSAAFVTYIVRMAGVPQTIIPNLFSTEQAIEFFGHKDLAFAPSRLDFNAEPADLILFSDNGRMGIIVGTEGKKYKYVELDSTGTKDVTKSIVKTSNLIKAIITPAYESATDTTKLPAIIKPVYIAEFQSWLKMDTITGVLDAETKRQVLKTWKTVFSAMAKTKLNIDGPWDNDDAMLADTKVVKLGSKSRAAYLLQGLLLAHGYDCKNFNGLVGKTTIDALEVFQRARKLEVKPSTSSAVWKSLLTR